jgi:hypothetical protein
MRSLLVMLAVVAAAPALAAEAYAVSVEDLARTSDAVVRGRVDGSVAELSDDKQRVYTTYDLRIGTTLRGRTPSVVRVMVPGGVVGRLGQRVDGAPSLGRGEDVVLFLKRAGPDAYVVTGLAQGKFSVAGAVARPDLSHLHFVRTSVRAGERRSEEMPLPELERRVRTAR